MTEEQLEVRYAIEALRSGVPNRAAVRGLGCNQPRATKRFAEGLAAASRELKGNKQALGIVVSGGFGSGKSHVLKHFESLALAGGFVCSRVAISKETPMYDPVKFFRSA